MLKRIVRSIVVCLSFGIIFELPAVNAVDLPISNILPLVIGLLYWAVSEGNKELTQTLKEKITLRITSVIFTVSVVFSQIEVILQYDSGIVCLATSFVSVMGIYILCVELLKRIVNVLKEDALIIASQEKRDKGKWVFGITFVILMLIWGFSFLVSYPGIFSVDSLENLEQAVGIRNMDVLFPFYMTLFLRLCWNIGIQIWSEPNAGIALYCAIQMVILGLATSYLIYRIYKTKVKLIICVGILLYFALVPYHAHSSYMLLKDTPYAIGTMFFMLFMWEYYVYGEPMGRCNKIVKGVLFIIAGILMAMSRANGYYAFLLCLPFSLFIFFKKQKSVAGILSLMFLLILFARGPLFDYILSYNNQIVSQSEYPAFDVRYKKSNEVMADERDVETEVVEEIEATEVVEEIEAIETVEEASNKVVNNASGKYASSGIFILTVQQLGRVACDRILTEEEYERLSTIIDVEGMRENYNKYIITNSMNEIINRNTKEYMSVWFEFGLKYPYSYFIAWRDQTSGYWDPMLVSGGMDLNFCDRNSEVYQDSPFPDEWINMKEKINDKLMFELPIIGILWSNGFIVWLTFLAIALVVIKNDAKLTVIYTPLIALWLTLLVANPCNGALRYIYSFYLCLPLSLVIPFVKKESEAAIDNGENDTNVKILEV